MPSSMPKRILVFLKFITVLLLTRSFGSIWQSTAIDSPGRKFDYRPKTPKLHLPHLGAVYFKCNDFYPWKFTFTSYRVYCRCSLSIKFPSQPLDVVLQLTLKRSRTFTLQCVFGNLSRSHDTALANRACSHLGGFKVLQSVIRSWSGTHCQATYERK